jgi:hypothetical protein
MDSLERPYGWTAFSFEEVDAATASCTANHCKLRSPWVPLSVGLKQMVALPPETFLAEVRL